ncbi:MAG: S41 family peptidase [Nanopusillaceae archaeon]
MSGAKVVVAGLVSAGVVVWGSRCIAGESKYWAYPQILREKVDEVWQLIYRSYIGPGFDRREWRKLRSEYLNRRYYSLAQVYEAAESMVKRINEPFSFLRPPWEKPAEEAEVEDISGFGFAWRREPGTGELRVSHVHEGQAAVRGGIQVGDVLLAINGQEVTGLKDEDIVALMGGSWGTDLNLTIGRGDQRLNVLLLRERRASGTVSAALHQTAVAKVGYICIAGFDRDTPYGTRRAIRWLEQEGVVGYILDLRHNPGGAGFAAAFTADLWLPKGVLIYTIWERDEDSQRLVARHYRSLSRPLTNSPLVLLVNQHTISAAENLALSLQDHRRAVVVGVPSFGKTWGQGYVLIGAGWVGVSTSYTMTPKSRNMLPRRVIPDILIQDPQQQLLHAIKLLTKS